METESNSWINSTGKKNITRGPGATAKLKPALFFSGRVHPGETPASWMMKGKCVCVCCETKVFF